MAHRLHALKFAKLLTEAVQKIRIKENKTVAIVQDELGFALGKTGGSMIEHWRKGKALPSKIEDIKILAFEIRRRGKYNRAWMSEFIRVSDHPDPDSLLSELFPQESQSQEKAGSLSRLTVVTNDPDRILLPSSRLPDPAPLPPGSIMPFGRNPLFVGRESDLLTLANALRYSETMAIGPMDTAAATGLGGIGKTQLASEFVHRFGQFFEGGVYWISFDNPDAIPAEIAACGGPKGLNLGQRFESRSLRERTDMVLAEWQKPMPRLLVFDNCEDPELVLKWRPKYGGCRILLTSRRGSWGKVLGVKMLPLATLSRDESVALLVENSGYQDLSVANEIAEELGDLPLALHLAGRYLRQYVRSVDPAVYLDQLRDARLLHHSSMQKGGISPTGHDQNVWRTFAMSYDLLDEAKPRDSLARRLLVHVAHFAPGEPIWYELLIKTLHLEPEHEFQAERALNRLIDVGLIETEENTTLRMHRLVARFVRDIAAEAYESAQQIVEETVHAYTKALNKEIRPMPLLAWQLHLRTVADLATIRKDAESARLCQELGRHLFLISDYHGAKLYVERALEIRPELFGEHHVETAESLLTAGEVYGALDNLQQAELYFERSYTINKSIHGSFSFDTAESLELMGRNLRAMGKFDLARKYTEEALEVICAIEGPESAKAANYHNNLAHCFFRLGKVYECIKHFETAESIIKKVLGEEHYQTGMILHNLGWTYQKIGRLNSALSYLNQAIAVWEKVYGGKYQFDALNSMDTKAQVLIALDSLNEAETLVNKMIDGMETLLGTDHIRTKFGYLTKSHMLYKMGKQNEAQVMAQNIVNNITTLLGKDHYLTQEAIKKSTEISTLN
ncbi:MAG: tetratricopeptide repeat protein [Chloroflexota bacterium]